MDYEINSQWASALGYLLRIYYVVSIVLCACISLQCMVNIIMIISGHALSSTEGRATFPFMDREPKYYSLFWGPGFTDDFFLLNY